MSVRECSEVTFVYTGDDGKWWVHLNGRLLGPFLTKARAEQELDAAL